MPNGYPHPPMGDDRILGFVLLDDRAYRAKSLRELKFTNRDAIKAHILALKERGGTDWSAGYREAIELFNKIEPNGEYENRIIFLTDAMPNSGELRRDRLFGLARSASDRDIHTTFIGVGVDFNSDLVEYISKVRGANYFTVNSSQEFKKLLDREFNYMVTPLVYDLKLELESRDYEIDAIYGSPEVDLASGDIMRVNTYSHLLQDERGGRGGSGVLL